MPRMLPRGLTWHDWSAHPWAMVLDAPPAASDWLPLTEWSTPCTQNRRLTGQQGRRLQVALPNGHRRRLVMALGARLPGVAGSGRMASRVTSARRGRGRPSGLIMQVAPVIASFPLCKYWPCCIFTCANQADVAVAQKLRWFRCPRSAGRDIAPGRFLPRGPLPMSVAENLGFAGQTRASVWAAEDGAHCPQDVLVTARPLTAGGGRQ
jgi:hypothetical protein